MHERDGSAIRGPRRLTIEAVGIPELRELAGSGGARLEQPETGAAVSLASEDDAAPVGGPRWVEVLGGIAHRVRQRPRRTPAPGQLPELPEQVEDDRPPVGRKVEAEGGPLVHADGDCLRGRRPVARGGEAAEQDGHDRTAGPGHGRVRLRIGSLKLQVSTGRREGP
jgi:hypothetical protein